MLLRIANFKSIDEIEVQLAPLTILLGPPASGKSNILDAIALIGYFNRLLLLDKEYDSNAANLEPLQSISRFSELKQLFKYHDLSKRISIEVDTDSGKRVSLEIWYGQGRINIKVNDVAIPWDLKTLATGPFQEVRNPLSQVAKGELLIEARLYGYDRYGLASSTCTAPTVCGFHLHLKGAQSRSVPRNIMSEFGWNANTIIRVSQDVVIQLNEVLREYMDEKIEVKVLRSGNVIVFDYDYEVNSLAVSDSIFRALYYLMAIKSAMNYAKLYGLEGKFILLLEEPEAHVFPYFLDMLADYIAKAKEFLYVVIATHNPMLVSMLWDRISDLKTYYVARDRYGSTRVWEVSIEKMAEELKSTEELLSMPPREILSKYATATGGARHAEPATE